MEGWKGDNIATIRKILNDLLKYSTLYFKIFSIENIHQNLLI